MLCKKQPQNLSDLHLFFSVMGLWDSRDSSALGHGQGQGCSMCLLSEGLAASLCELLPWWVAEAQRDKPNHTSTFKASDWTCVLPKFIGQSKYTTVGWKSDSISTGSYWNIMARGCDDSITGGEWRIMQCEQ